VKITNKLNLPQPFVSAVTSDYEYKDKQYSVTSLLGDSLRETMLKRRYHHEIEQDVADMIWMIVGNGIHKVLEDAEEESHELKEEYLNIEVGDDYKISGKADLYNAKDKKVTDYKTCSVWKIIYGDYEDWRKQLLMYAWMFSQIGFDARSGEIVAIMKDHSKSKAKFDKDYPQFPVQTITFNFTDDDFIEIENYIKAKFEEIKKLEQVSDEELPMCSLKDRFNNGNKYAVKKKANKTATKLHDTLEEAQAHLDNLEKQYPNIYEIETRLGEDKKCLEYCSVCNFCPYYKEKYMNKGEM
jgi:hypothetical protein